MTHLLCRFLALSLSLSSFLLCSETPAFGYISYSTYNIGDDIQAIAAQNLLQGKLIGLDRELISTYSFPKPLPTLINGWFMHTKTEWYRTDIPAPEKSWPPSPSLRPLILSIYFHDCFLPHAFSKESIAYLKQNGPIGARDLSTLEELQKRNIPCYFSGCLTLTLDYPQVPRNNIIYAIDLDQKCLDYLKKHTKSPIRCIRHESQKFPAMTQEQRLYYAKNLLRQYNQAKAVVTTRLHAAMPCLALTTPVFLITSPTNRRLSGLRELTHHCSKEQFLSGQFDFNFDAPPENPRDYLILRKNLKERVSKWVDSYGK